MTPPILGIWASQISGHLWEPAGAYDALATITIGSTATSSIVFAGIPTGYKHLQIRGIARHTGATSDYASYPMVAVINSDTATTSYATHTLTGNASTASAAAVTSWGGGGVGGIAGNETIANTFSGFVIDILDYANTSKNKTMRGLTGTDSGTTLGVESGLVGLYSSVWLSTSAITSINLKSIQGHSFAQYSSFALYGIK